MAAAAEYGPWLRNQHVIFVIDNTSDVSVINRQRTRHPRVATLLRALTDTALRFNFSFSAVHRLGTDNVLMDWASRPEYHGFRAPSRPLLQAAAHRAATERAAGLRRRGQGPGEGAPPYPPSPFPPMLYPLSHSFLNSRCVTVTRASSVIWDATTLGW